MVVADQAMRAGSEALVKILLIKICDLAVNSYCCLVVIFLFSWTVIYIY